VQDDKASQLPNDQLADLARECGVEIVACGPGWGGRFGYKSADAPNVKICGYRTKRSALTGWLEDEFGSIAGQVMCRRLGL
jgi:hypothetical protein